MEQKAKHSEPACQVILAWGHLFSGVSGNSKGSIYFSCVHEGPGDIGVSRVQAYIAPAAGGMCMEDESQYQRDPHQATWMAQC